MVTGVPLGIGPGVCRYKIVSVHGLIVIVTRIQRDRHVGQRKASTCAGSAWGVSDSTLEDVHSETDMAQPGACARVN